MSEKHSRVFYLGITSSSKQRVARLLCTENCLPSTSHLGKGNPFAAALRPSVPFVVLGGLRSRAMLGAASQEAGKEANAIAGLHDGERAV